MCQNKNAPIIIGNWKMNNDLEESKNLLNNIVSNINNLNHNIIICVPFISLNLAVNLVKNTGINVSAQNCHYENYGAFTGEISAKMIKNTGANYVILGHSERRKYFGETDEIINKKVKTALNNNLKIIVCVGETLQQKNYNITNEIISIQLKKCLYGFNKNNLQNVIIAYEPVWAIGSNKPISNNNIDSICKLIKKIVYEMYNIIIPVVYGGSVNYNNARDLLAKKNINGLIVGGASLNADEFLKITKISF